MDYKKEALAKKTVIEWLQDVDYSINPKYVPSNFALSFVNFIKMVNGGQGEENLTPVIHYEMLNDVATLDDIINLCHRGVGKTAIFAEYLILYIAVYGEIEGFGKIPLGIYVSDSIENGVKNLRKNLEYRWENSEFLRQYIPHTRFTDIRWEFRNIDGVQTVFKGYGARALSLDTVLYTEEGKTTIGDCSVGDKLYGPDGNLATITQKSELFSKPMYKLELEDGRHLKVSEDHINSVLVNTTPNGTANWVDKDLTTNELIATGFTHTKLGNKNHRGTSTKCTMKVRNTLPLSYPEKTLTIEPYTLGLILGDGSVKKNGSAIVITGLGEDVAVYRNSIPYDVGDNYLDRRTKDVFTFSVKGINQKIRDLDLVKHGNHKFIPEEYFYASIKQRLSMLRGLLDTDGYVSPTGRIDFSSNSKVLAEDVMRLVRSLGGKAKMRVKTTDRGNPLYRPEIWIGMNPFNLPRKRERFIANRKHWNTVNVVGITSIQYEPSQCISIDNEDRQFLAGEYFRTHNTGVRGAKEMAIRPTLAILDDLVSDEDARSATVIASIEDTVYKAVDYALHPTRKKVIWSGTPFNAKDPLYKAVESGVWKVNVFPVCEKFPCSKEDFRGSWEDRFPYEYVLAQYTKAMESGKIDTFNQEMMLKIMSDEDRLILDADIRWFKRDLLLQNKGKYNFYITTDFATSERESADFSFISVWGYNHNGDWFWCDGMAKRQDMSENIDALFRFVSAYSPLGVGVEVSGQQGGFVTWLYDEMSRKNCYFNIVSDSNSNKPGIRPTTNKMTRFQTVVPMFKMGKMYFPTEYKDEHPALIEIMDELTLAAPNGFRSKHDDGIDTISMLSVMKAFKPDGNVSMSQKADTDIWEDEDDRIVSNSRLSNYIV